MKRPHGGSAHLKLTRAKLFIFKNIWGKHDSSTSFKINSMFQRMSIKGNLIPISLHWIIYQREANFCSVFHISYAFCAHVGATLQYSKKRELIFLNFRCSHPYQKDTSFIKRILKELGQMHEFYIAFFDNQQFKKLSQSMPCSLV